MGKNFKKYLGIILIELLVVQYAYSQHVGYSTYTFNDTQQLSVWYPATTVVCHYQNYLENVNVKYLSTQTEPNVNEYLDVYLSQYVYNTKIDFSKIINIKASNCLSPLKTEVTHPLIIYAPGYRGLSFENSLLCEMLAESGYIVAAVPSLGVKYKTDSLGLEIQIDYIQKAIGYLTSQKYVDRNNISLIGFSWGGLSSIMTAFRNKSIKSVVSLDGSIRFFYSLAEKMPGFNPSEFDRSVLLFGAEGNDHVDFRFFDQLKKAPAYLVKMKGFNHLDFMSYRSLETPYKDSVKAEGYFKMLQTIKQFLNANGTLPDSAHLKSEFSPSFVYIKP
ncbi:MAG: acyl-CoA thioester hydrolase/BAAT C-terminal domain-containing protein [Cyclobacteriaceae bacterium]